MSAFIVSMLVMSYVYNGDPIGLTTAEIGIIVTVLLFATAHLIMLMKWGSNLDKNTGVLAARLDTLSQGQEKLERAVASIVDVHARFDYIEKVIANNASRSSEGHIDHEKRLREVEKKCAVCGPSL